MSMKKTLLSLFCVVLSVFMIGCFPQVEVSGQIEDMTKEDFAKISEDVKRIDVYDYKKHKVCTIKLYDEILEIIDILVNIYPISGSVESEGNSLFLLMYNENKELICYISLWRKGYLGFGEIGNKEYALDIEYINSLEVFFE